MSAAQVPATVLDTFRPPFSMRAGRTACALALAAGVAGAGCDQLRGAPAFHGAAIEPAAPAPALRLPVATPAARDTFDLARETAAGRAALVFFGYTHCPDVCPTTLADWARARRLLGPDAARVRFVFVTVDPERDTPAVVGRYVAQFAGVTGLAGSPAAVEATQRAWGVASYREEGGGAGGYTVAHPAQVFAVDPQGRLRLTYALGARPADVAADLRALLGE